MSTASELQEKGVHLFQQKEYEDAGPVFEQAIAAYQADQQPEMAAEMMVNLGLVRRALGENDAALELMQAALEVFQQSTDRKREAMVLGNMGGVYLALSDKEQAASAYRDAAEIFDALGEKKLHGETLLAIAQMQIGERRIGDAAATYEAGLSELDQLTASQKVLKGLISVRNRLTGSGGAI